MSRLDKKGNLIGGRAKNGGKGGRNGTDDPKVPVQVYIYKSRIEELGGIEKAREIAKKKLEEVHIEAS